MTGHRGNPWCWFKKTSLLLKTLVLVPPTFVLVAGVASFAGNQLPATRGRVEAVEIRVEAIDSAVQLNHRHGHSALAQQAQMLCLMEDDEPGRAERCLRVYQEKTIDLDEDLHR